ncbi:serine carboxypeptidase [Histoplasma ohiense]|nr:serine carboxypeptidase [Histoplasma ohiense (nom. inval.)]
MMVTSSGGPGCSSVIGALSESGPLTFVGNASMPTANPYSWTKLGSVLYIDQPVGTGFSTSSSSKPISKNEKVTSDLYAWLGEFYREFPHLLEKKTHLVGESYAGIFVPYFASEIVKHRDSLPINLKSISVGNGILGNNAVMADVAVGAYLETNAPILDIPQDVIHAFSSADHICKFDTVLNEASEYPPSVPISVPGNPENLNFRRDELCRTPSDSDAGPMAECNTHPREYTSVMESILNSTCHGPCATFSTAADYFETRSNLTHDCFNLYNIKYDCGTINPLGALTTYLNRVDVQTSLHIPQSNTDKSSKKRNKPYPFQGCNSEIMQALLGPANRPTPPAYFIIPDLISTHNISTHIYHGKLDMLINHIAVELVLQNMTWNRRQGFLWTAERGLTYHLFNDAGHVVPFDQPEEMFWYGKEVILGGSE